MKSVQIFATLQSRHASKRSPNCRRILPSVSFESHYPTKRVKKTCQMNCGHISFWSKRNAALFIKLFHIGFAFILLYVPTISFTFVSFRCYHLCSCAFCRMWFLTLVENQKISLGYEKFASMSNYASKARILTNPRNWRKYHDCQSW